MRDRERRLQDDLTQARSFQQSILPPAHRRRPRRAGLDVPPARAGGRRHLRRLRAGARPPARVPGRRRRPRRAGLPAHHRAQVGVRPASRPRTTRPTACFRTSTAGWPPSTAPARWSAPPAASISSPSRPAGVAPPLRQRRPPRADLGGRRATCARSTGDGPFLGLRPDIDLQLWEETLADRRRPLRLQRRAVRPARHRAARLPVAAGRRRGPAGRAAHGGGARAASSPPSTTSGGAVAATDDLTVIGLRVARRRGVRRRSTGRSVAGGRCHKSPRPML